MPRSQTTTPPSTIRENQCLDPFNELPVMKRTAKANVGGRVSRLLLITGLALLVVSAFLVALIRLNLQRDTTASTFRVFGVVRSPGGEFVANKPWFSSTDSVYIDVVVRRDQTSIRLVDSWSNIRLWDIHSRISTRIVRIGDSGGERIGGSGVVAKVSNAGGWFSHLAPEQFGQLGARIDREQSLELDFEVGSHVRLAVSPYSLAAQIALALAIAGLLLWTRPAAPR